MVAVLLSIVCLQALPADDPDYEAELPRIPALEPNDALKSFQLSSSEFEIEQVAAEPLIASPVAIDFDPDGRMFVVEMRDYSEQDKERLGRVRLLEDADGDGRFDKATVFAEDLSWPTAVACANGGVIVGAAPDIYFLKDDDGDGRADTKTILFTGFNRNNVQGLLNSFQWGLDNRLHGATSTAGGDVRRGDDKHAKVVALRGRDFAINTRTLEITPESGGGQHGMSFDDWGRKFVSSNSDHIQLITAEDRYLARNPFLAAPPPRESIAADGPQAEVFRISPVEPWRIVRTRLRVAGAVPGPVEGGGRAAGYFTGATGVTIFRGNAWPDEFRGNAFIGDVGSNIVHRKTLWPDGVLLTARRAEQNHEFLASSDIWFRPAQFANGPDGNLYVIDVYREVIEHPASLPPVIKKHLDLTSGRDRGRIYRIKPREFSTRSPVRLSRASTAELVALLEHTNGWHRTTASRLLFERQDQTAAPLLRALASQSKSPLARMHALWALEGLNALSSDLVLAGMRDKHAGVRRHSVRLAERLVQDGDVRAAIAKLAADEDLMVRYQLAFTAGELPVGEQVAPLAAIARRDAAHRWMRVALQSSLAEGAADLAADLLGDAAFRASAGGRELLTSLAQQVGAQGRQPAVAKLGDALQALALRKADSPLVQAIAVALIRGAAGGGVNPATQDGLLKQPAIASAVAQAVEAARSAATNKRQSVAVRLQAIETLNLASFADLRETMVTLLAADQPADVQLAAASALARRSEGEAIDLLLDSWAGLTPRMRAAALDRLLTKRENILRLLDAVENGNIHAAQIDPGRVKQLREHRDRRVQERALRLWAAIERDRNEVVRQYQKSLSISGSIEKGRAVFRSICAACHRAESVGYEVGPNLATMQNRGAEAILLAVLDPNREVNPQYVNYTVVTKTGQTASGMIAGESSTAITLRRGEGQTDTILRSDIEGIESAGVSLMPEGVEKQITVEAMADLLAYLSTLK